MSQTACCEFHNFANPNFHFMFHQFYALYEPTYISVNDPTCRTNPSLTNVLVENDCDLDPDNIEFNCSIAYRGNVPPDMQLMMSTIGVLDNVTVSSWVQSNTNYHLVQWVSKARRQMRDGRFQCEVRTTVVDIPPSCSTEKVSVMCEYPSNDFYKLCPIRASWFGIGGNTTANQFVEILRHVNGRCKF